MQLAAEGQFMSNEEIIQIAVAGIRIGINGLKPAIEAAKALQGCPDEEIAQFLFSILKFNNYISAAVQEDYRQAFLREYKKAMGEKITEARHGLTIRMLGPGCPSCHSLEQMVMAVVAELGLPAAIEHVTDVKEIARLGVLATPSLMINDDLKASGHLPSKESLKKWLLEYNAE
jgi:small redox-active disulfide protein 2